MENPLTEDEIKILHGFAAMLDKCERQGGPIDMPEGARTIKCRLSDTFAHQVSMALRKCTGTITALEATVAEQAEGLEALRNQVNLITDPKIIIPGRK